MEETTTTNPVQPNLNSMISEWNKLDLDIAMRKKEIDELLEKRNSIGETLIDNFKSNDMLQCKISINNGTGVEYLKFVSTNVNEGGTLTMKFLEECVEELFESNPLLQEFVMDFFKSKKLAKTTKRTKVELKRCSAV